MSNTDPQPGAAAFFRGVIAAPPSCERCPLRGQKVVPPEGNPHAKIAIVGEGPGEEEVHYGRPFIGRSGQLLDSLLRTVGLDRSELWITNSTMCRPKSARYLPMGDMYVDLGPDEAKRIAAKYCRYRLLTELSTVNPTTIVPLGGIAYEAVIGTAHSIQARRGAIAEVDLATRARSAWAELTRLHGHDPASVTT